MPQYIGFSTQNANKPPTRNATYGSGGGVGSITSPLYTGRKFSLYDQQLVVNDFINALNIRQGEKPGKPGYGTTLWNFVFDPNTTEYQMTLQQEISRVASLDPRLKLAFVAAYPKENGILIEAQVSVVPFAESILLSVFFDGTTNKANIQ